MWKVLKANKSFILCSITAIFAAVVITNPAAANERITEENKNQTPYTITSKQWLNNTKEVITSPASWDNSDWNKALLLGGLAYFIHDKDDKVQHHFQENRNGTTNDINQRQTDLNSATERLNTPTDKEQEVLDSLNAEKTVYADLNTLKEYGYEIKYSLNGR